MRAAASLTATLLLVTACASSGAPAALPAPRHFAALPPPCHLPDLTASVERYDTPRAAHCLVHIRQVHAPAMFDAAWAAEGEADRLALRERLETANSVQREIFEIVRLLARAGYRDVFSEGLTVEEPYEGREAMLLDSLGTLARIEASGCFPGAALMDAFASHGALRASGDPDFDAVRFVPGAEILLGLSGEIDVRPAERRDALHAARRALEDVQVSGWSDETRARLFDDREDTLLDLVAAHGAPGAIALLGGWHDLTDNVRRWNREHPDRPFSLVVVTPAGYW